jgi:hypothetical protein
VADRGARRRQRFDGGGDGGPGDSYLLKGTLVGRSRSSRPGGSGRGAVQRGWTSGSRRSIRLQLDLVALTGGAGTERNMTWEQYAGCHLHRLHTAGRMTIDEYGTVDITTR